MPRPTSVPRPFSSCSKQMAHSSRHEAHRIAPAAVQHTSRGIVEALVQEMYSALASEGNKQAAMILDQVKSLGTQLHELASNLKSQQQQTDATTSKLEGLSSSLDSITATMSNLPEATASVFMKMEKNCNAQHKACLIPEQGSPDIPTSSAQGHTRQRVQAHSEHQAARSKQHAKPISALPSGVPGKLQLIMKVLLKPHCQLLPLASEQTYKECVMCPHLQVQRGQFQQLVHIDRP